MNDINLSKHFKLSEFTKSSTASARNIDNTPSEEVIANLRNLCVKLLEPMRQHFNVPIVISSGYRCPALNKSVGGVANSQHMKGEAADLHIPFIKTANGSFIQDMQTARKWIEYLLDQRFDQLILEHDKTGHYWIHVSLKRDDSRNRQTYIPNLLKK